MTRWLGLPSVHWASALVLTGLVSPISLALIEHHQSIFWPLFVYLLLALTFLQVVPAAACTVLGVAGSAWLSLHYLHTERGQLLLGEGLVVLICVAILFLRYTLHDTRAKLQIIKQQKAYLQLSEDRFRQLLQSAPISILVSDAQGRIVLVNQHAADLFGYSLEHLQQLAIPDLVPVDVRARHREARERYYRNPYDGGVYAMGQGDYVFRHSEVRGLRADGTIFPATIYLGHIYLGHAILVIAIALDMTHQHDLEALHLELQAEQIRTQAAEAAVRERDTFLSIAAHELKTPLTNLSGYAQLGQDLLRRAESRPEPLPEAYLALRREATLIMETMSRQSAKMTVLINRLLDLGRLSSGTLTLEIAPLDLVQLAREATELVQALYPERTIELLLPEQAYLAGDSLRLEQVLVNLLDNALKYSPTTEPVQLQLVADEHHTFVTVTDRGPGIAPDKRAQVFERFYQESTNGHRTGLGLGLYLAREIVQRHGGTITLEDTPGARGTSVLVALPYMAPHLPPDNPSDMPRADAKSPGEV